MKPKKPVRRFTENLRTEHSEDVMCLHCVATKLLECLDEIPINYDRMRQILFQIEQDYIKPDSTTFPEWQEHLQILQKIQDLIQDANFDELRKELTNIQFMAGYRNREGEFF